MSLCMCVDLYAIYIAAVYQLFVERSDLKWRPKSLPALSDLRHITVAVNTLDRSPLYSPKSVSLGHTSVKGRPT